MADKKYIKSVLWRVAKRLSYIEDARCLKVKGVWAAECFSLLSDSHLTVAAHSVLETRFAVDLDTERCFIFRNDILPTLRIRVTAHSIISWESK